MSLGGGAHDFLRHGAIYFALRAVNGVLAIGTVSLFTRLLSVEEYGLYALSVTAASIGAGVLFQWLNVGVGRLYPAYLDNPTTLLKAAQRMYAIGALVALLTALVVVYARERIGVSVEIVAIIFAMTLLQGRYDLFLQIANAGLAPERYALISWAKLGIGLAIGCALTSLGAGYVGALLGVLVGLGAACFVANRALISPLAATEMDLGSSIPGALMRYGIPLAFTFVALLIVDLSDRIMIASMLGVSYVGPYAASYDLTQQVIGALMHVVFLAGYPSIVMALESQEHQAVSQRLRTLGNLFLGVGFASAVGLSVLDHQIAAIIFGVEFREQAPKYISIISVAVFVATFKSYFLDLTFQLGRATRLQAYIAVLMAVVNILLNVILLPRFGPIAAAWSTLAAYSVGALASLVVGIRVFRLPSLGSDSVKIIFSAGAMYLALSSLPRFEGVTGLCLAALIGAGTYLAMLIALNVGSVRPVAWALLGRSSGS